jgi:hypothetical protein
VITEQQILAHAEKFGAQYFGRHRARHTVGAAVVRVLAFLLAVSR